MGVHVRALHSLEDLQIMRGDSFGLVGRGEILAQVRQDGCDAGRLLARCLQRIVQLFAGHEAGDRAANERRPRGAVPQPGAGG
jgi:hypothetical protein